MDTNISLDSIIENNPKYQNFLKDYSLYTISSINKFGIKKECFVFIKNDIDVNSTPFERNFGYIPDPYSIIFTKNSLNQNIIVDDSLYSFIYGIFYQQEKINYNSDKLINEQLIKKHFIFIFDSISLLISS
jgi:hypothetical protein